MESCPSCSALESRSTKGIEFGLEFCLHCFHAVLVVKRPGIALGEDALAVMRVEDMARLLRAAGYGDAADDEERAS